MPQLLADRFLPSGSSWIDLASGAAVRVRLAAAGSPGNQIAWNNCCAVLANLRHPLVNPLVDYGMADAGHIFEAYAMQGPIRATGASGAGLLAHAVRFLQANGVGLPRPLADYILREVTAGRGRPVRPVGISLQPRHVFDAIHEALDAGGPAGACAMAIAGEPHSGLRTLRQAAARAARLEGYVPIATSVLRRRAWLAAALVDRHVCVLAGEEPGDEHAVAAVITRLGAASPRRHVVLSFTRTAPKRPAVQVERMGIVALMDMVFLDAAYGPTPAELFDAARASGGRPGQFLSRLGASEPDVGGALAMSVHESTEPYEVDVRTESAAVALRAVRQAAGVLSRAPERSEVLARAGRHAAARRLLQRAMRVFSARGERMHAARCAIRLGWLSIERAQLAAAVDSFERARAVSPDSTTSIRAGIGTGVAWTDEGRLADAEAALRAAVLAAQRLEDTTLSAQAVAWLGRCLFWQGRYDEAAAVLRGVADTKIGARDRACVLLTLARVHVAEEATATAVRTARQAVDCATEAQDPLVLAAAFRILAHVVSAAGDPASAVHHVADGLRVARRAHLPLECARLRLTALDIQARSGASPQIRLRGARLATASAPWPPLLRFHAQAVRARVDGAEPDARIRAFIETSGAVAIAHASGAPAANPVADLEALLDIGQTAADDHTAVERVSEQLRTKLRAAAVIVIGPEPGRRILALTGRPWHGDPHAAWRALASGLSVTADPFTEPCQAAEPLRYGGEVIGSVSARWIAGSALDPARAGALLRVGALALAASVRALLDRTVPGPAAHPCEEILGTSAAARSMQESIARAARAPYPVLIEGAMRRV
jgi:tetratricopeptide (TPR) repeat protein